jgi:hypothetical protein
MHENIIRYQYECNAPACVRPFAASSVAVVLFSSCIRNKQAKTSNTNETEATAVRVISISSSKVQLPGLAQAGMYYSGQSDSDSDSESSFYTLLKPAQLRSFTSFHSYSAILRGATRPISPDSIILLDNPSFQGRIFFGNDMEHFGEKTSP